MLSYIDRARENNTEPNLTEIVLHSTKQKKCSFKTVKLKSYNLNSYFLFFFAVARKRLFLFTIFGMSLKYQSVDLSLAVSCGLLPLLHDLCGSPRQLCKVMCTVVYNQSKSDVDGLLQLACFRLWQIITLSLGYV